MDLRDERQQSRFRPFRSPEGAYRDRS